MVRVMGKVSQYSEAHNGHDIGCIRYIFGNSPKSRKNKNLSGYLMDTEKKVFPRNKKLNQPPQIAFALHPNRFCQLLSFVLPVTLICYGCRFNRCVQRPLYQAEIPNQPLCIAISTTVSKSRPRFSALLFSFLTSITLSYLLSLLPEAARRIHTLLHEELYEIQKKGLMTCEHTLSPLSTMIFTPHPATSFTHSLPHLYVPYPARARIRHHPYNLIACHPWS